MTLLCEVFGNKCHEKKVIYHSIEYRGYRKTVRPQTRFLRAVLALYHQRNPYACTRNHRSHLNSKFEDCQRN
jgi:hypothetical protein